VAIGTCERYAAVMGPEPKKQRRRSQLDRPPPTAWEPDDVAVESPFRSARTGGRLALADVSEVRQIVIPLAAIVAVVLGPPWERHA